MLLASCASVAGVDGEAKIFNGEPAPAEDYVVSLALPEVGGCSGIYLGGRYVLTAGHCVPTPFSLIAITTFDAYGRAASGFADRAVVHEGWTAATKDHGCIAYGGHESDIAVLYLEAPLQYNRALTFDEDGVNAGVAVPSATLAGELPPLGTQVRTVGFGTTGGIDAHNRRAAEMTIVEHEDPLVYFRGVENGETRSGACGGDSGGATIHQGEVLAVSGFTRGDATDRCRGDVLGATSVPHYRQWIQGAMDHLATQSRPGVPGATCFDNHAPPPDRIAYFQKGIRESITTSGWTTLELSRDLRPRAVSSSVDFYVGLTSSNEVEIQLEALSESGVVLLQKQLPPPILSPFSHRVGTAGVYVTSGNVPEYDGLPSSVSWRLRLRGVSADNELRAYEFNVWLREPDGPP